MQLDNWDDLRYVLALKRGRTLVAAAKLLGVNSTTISRRIKALEKILGNPIVHRLPDGRLELTAIGEVITTHAENAENQINRLQESLGSQTSEVSGVVRLTSVPIVINRILVPALQPLLSNNPALHIELIPGSSNLSFSHREADLAIRLARPVTGGTLLKTRKLGALHCSVYNAAELSTKQIASLPWIAYDDTMAHLPSDRWIRQTAAKCNDDIATIKVNDVETALQAVYSKLGKTVLPDAIATNDSRLKKYPDVFNSSPPARDLWLVSQANQAQSKRIVTVVDWLTKVLSLS